jgi:hypothetical protein
MLSFSEHRLWIMRMEKPGYQQSTMECIRRTGKKGWMMQPVLGRETPGFLATFDAPRGTSAPLKSAILRSHELLRQGISSRSRGLPHPQI